jgi:hypothetical protein
MMSFSPEVTPSAVFKPFWERKASIPSFKAPFRKPESPKYAPNTGDAFAPATELPAPSPRTIWSSASNASSQTSPGARVTNRDSAMAKFLLFCILFVLCWPLALLALVAYPIVWLLLIPFRILGIAVGGVLELVGAVIFLPARVIRAI